MRHLSRRSLFASVLVVGLLPTTAVFAADKPDTINIDWATYNPVSILLKNKGWLEKEFEKDNIKIRWVQTLGSNKALEFLNAGSIDFGSTAGSAALVAKINGNPIKSIYVYSRPEWTALVTRKDSTITKVSDLNRPDVKIAVGLGSREFETAKRLFPKAQLLALQIQADVETLAPTRRGDTDVTVGAGTGACGVNDTSLEGELSCAEVL